LRDLLMDVTRLCCSLLFTFSLFAQWVAVSSAQDDDARAAFESGMNAVRRKDFETAADAFEHAFALQATPNIEYNLAAALFELGRFVSAQQHLERVLAEPTLGQNVRLAAIDLQERLRPHVARLSVNVIVDGEQDPHLYVDDAEVAADEWSAPHAVEPGLHHVRVMDGFETLVERDISVEPGREANLDLQLVPVPVVVEVPAAPPAKAPAPLDEIDVEPTRGRSWKLWVGISAAVVVSAAALGVGFGLRDKSDSTPHTEGTLGPGALVW
jgi:hypothetical protein